MTPDEYAPADINLADALLRMIADAPFQEGWETRWDDEPYRFKFYADGQKIALPEVVDARLQGLVDHPEAAPILSRLSHWLAFVAGPQSTRQNFTPRTDLPWRTGNEGSAVASREIKEMLPSTQNLFRTVPSGGALYPWEIYLYWRGTPELPQGIYHFDPAHHTLDVLGLPNSVTAPENTFCLDDRELAAVVVSARYWKNYFKYGNACLRLHGMDAGIVIGQGNQLAQEFGFVARCHFQYNDDAIARALGFSIDEEAAQAILTLRLAGAGGQADQRQLAPDAGDRGARPVRVVCRSEKVVACRAAQAYNALAAGGAPVSAEVSHADRQGDHPLLGLPAPTRAEALPATFFAALRRRGSGFNQIRPYTMSQQQLADLMAAGCSALARAQFPASDVEDLVSLYCVANRIDGLGAGVYAYDESRHGLRFVEAVASGTLQQALQDAYGPRNINFSVVSALIFVTGRSDLAFARFGNRARRILDLLAGMVAQQYYVTAPDAGLGCHAIYGFEQKAASLLLGIDAARTPMLLGVAFGGPDRNRASISLPLWR